MLFLLQKLTCIFTTYTLLKMINEEAFHRIKAECEAQQVTLVAVSKTKPMADLMALYDLGQRDFGENYVQELLEKEAALPKDIRWHFIGHLQSNKVKYIAPFVHLVHGVDSEKLLAEISKQGQKIGRVVKCLLQVFIAEEETKFGMDEGELKNIDLAKYGYVEINGLMGMASNTTNPEIVKKEFDELKQLYDKSEIRNPKSKILSMGMSGDYQLAIASGSNMVRVGSLIFGERHKPLAES